MGEARRRKLLTGAAAAALAGAPRWTEPSRFETVAAGDPISQVAAGLLETLDGLAASAGISRFDVLVAFANVTGHLLADQKDMDRAHALARMDDLRAVMEGAYDLRDIRGEG